MHRTFIPTIVLVFSLPCVAMSGSADTAGDSASSSRPNILWLTAEDLSPNLGCYGDTSARTPHLDAFAEQGLRYTRAFATAPVCSPARSCLITGMYATSLGTQRLRSQFPVPQSIRGFSAYLREAGYYCSNNVKTDYNLRNEATFVEDSWDESSTRAHWRKRSPGQPFFAVFNFMTTHQSRTSVWPHAQFEQEIGSKLTAEQRHDPALANLPPYYPDTTESRRAWARYHDCATRLDQEIGAILDELESDGLAEDTIVFFYGDHGMGMPRGKRVLQDSGLQVPLIIRFPEKWRHLAPAAPGETIDRLVSFVDFAPSVLSLCNVAIPDHMQGTAFIGPRAGESRQYVFGARDRVDEVFDLSRSVRDRRWLYIRNFMPHYSWMPPERYSDHSTFRRELKRLAAAGALGIDQLTYAAPRRAVEELYDTAADPHQLRNLAESAAHRQVLERMRDALRQWQLATRDAGFLTEPQMWQRMGARLTPLELARDDSRYPLVQLLDAADLVGRREAWRRQVELLPADDDAVRYWGAVGLHACEQLPDTALQALQNALKDSSPVVRVEAAAALATHGQADLALPVLADELQSPQPEVTLHAARALELLAPSARPLWPAMRQALQRARTAKPDNDIMMFVRFSLEAALEDFTPIDHLLFEPAHGVRAGIAASISDIVHVGPPGIIRPPVEGQAYEAWLDAMHRYRNLALDLEPDDASERERFYTIDFQGHGGCWLRLNDQLSRALALKPGEELTWTIEARAQGNGNDTCYLAFDIHNLEGHKISWSKLDESPVEVPRDGQWHTLVVKATVPQFNQEEVWMRPIFGMDQLCDPTPGKIDLRNFQLLTDDAGRVEAIRDATPEHAPLDMSLYDREDLRWLATSFSYHFTFMYDLSFYDPQSGEFTLDEFLADGEREFGGYDAVLLWQAYPRIGFDERNQFDFYRDMPGGLKGLRKLVDEFHRRGLKVHIDYNPWDRATRREDVSDARALADLVAAIDCDGIFLDTLSSGSSDLRVEVDSQRTGVVLVPELYPRLEDLPFLMGSWYQFGTNPFPEPGILHHKWIEPRHMQYQISRWKGHGREIHLSHYQEIENAFFNGSGMTVWENIFGTYNPWPAENRMLWSHAIRILRAYQHHFVSGSWQPYYPTEQDQLFANRFTLERETVFTLVNHGQPLRNARLLAVDGSAAGGRVRAYDLWNGRELELIEQENNRYQVIGSVDRLGAVLITVADQPEAKLARLLDMQRRQDWTARLADDVRIREQPVVQPRGVEPTSLVPLDAKPEGMALVPRSEITMQLSHKTIESGCYPDPSAHPDEWESKFFIMGQVEHRIGPLVVGPFLIDETEVTNAQFKAFLDATGYVPQEPKNFLKHWPDGRMPEQLAEHPVVYVDLDDARAYAAWAGKRLPREEEWHLAAQGTDGRKWPWGNEDPTPQRANLTGTHTLPARSCEAGRSPYGCYHMSGNVYEWTESQRSDGHTRFVMVRGGSYFDPHANPDTSSIWYNDGGPRPCDHHAKFILMYPGLDRCSTIGFRCVKDAAVESVDVQQ